MGEPIGVIIILGVAAVLWRIWTGATLPRPRRERRNRACIADQLEYWNGWRPGYRIGRDDDLPI